MKPQLQGLGQRPYKARIGLVTGQAGGAVSQEHFLRVCKDRARTMCPESKAKPA